MKRETLKKRISALRDKTTERGCTEAEAMAAAAKAAQLMLDHGISENDVIMDQVSVRRKSEGNSARDPLWRKLASCTNTAAIFHHDDSGRPVRIYIGRDPGPEIAAYLHQVLDRAIDKAISDFKSSAHYRRRRSLKTKRLAVAEFTYAMVLRLCIRLSDLFASAISEEAREAAVVARDELFPNNSSVAIRSRDLGKPTAASVDGFLAGSAVHLSHGVSAHGLSGLIGGEA